MWVSGQKSPQNATVCTIQIYIYLSLLPRGIKNRILCLDYKGGPKIFQTTSRVCYIFTASLSMYGQKRILAKCVTKMPIGKAMIDDLKFIVLKIDLFSSKKR